MNARSLAQSLGLGKLKYALVHRPIEVYEEIKRDGYFALQKAKKGRAEMYQGVRVLPKINYDIPADWPVNEITFLTGEKYWPQTFLCAYTLMFYSKHQFAVRLLDDGTLNQEIQDIFKGVFESVRVEYASAKDDLLEQNLPKSKFPSLRKRRLEYPHLKKVIDAHVGRTDFSIVLDSDMLFWKNPRALLDWMQRPEKPLCLHDIETSYGYSIPYLSELAGVEVPEKINVGTVGIKGADIDWQKMESFCHRTLSDHGSSYYQEQALVAIRLAQLGFVRLDGDDYVCYPHRTEREEITATLHHYVDNSSLDYFSQLWRTAIDRMLASHE